MSRYSFVFLFAINFSCLSCKTETDVGETSFIKIDNEFSFWIERDLKGQFIRAGISGRCENLDIDSYAIELDSILALSKKKDKDFLNVNKLYLNAYSAKALTRQLVGEINKVQQSPECCGNDNGNNCIELLIAHHGYINPIQDVITRNFGTKYFLSVEGVVCIPKDTLAVQYGISPSELLQSKYPGSFSLLVVDFVN